MRLGNQGSHSSFLPIIKIGESLLEDRSESFPTSSPPCIYLTTPRDGAESMLVDLLVI
jgi:hypothetical protein